MVRIRRELRGRKSGGLEPGHAFVAEVIADVRAEKAALRFCSEEGLVLLGLHDTEIRYRLAEMKGIVTDHESGIDGRPTPVRSRTALLLTNLSRSRR